MNSLLDLYSALDSASTAIALSSRDWAARSDVAWLYGIFVGWEDDPTGGDVDQGNALEQIAARFDWPSDDVARLRRLRAAVATFNPVGTGPLPSPRTRDRIDAVLRKRAASIWQIVRWLGIEREFADSNVRAENPVKLYLDLLVSQGRATLHQPATKYATQPVYRWNPNRTETQ